MEVVSGIILIIGGAIITLIGFKVINVFKGSDIEKANEWYKKYGLIIKTVGIIAIVTGLLNLI